LMYNVREFNKQDVYDIDVGYEFDRSLLVRRSFAPDPVTGDTRLECCGFLPQLSTKASH